MNAWPQIGVSVTSLLVKGIIHVKKLNLTALGRALEGDIYERASIFKVDRFFRNLFFLAQNHQQMLYQRMIHSLVGHKKRPQIIVDWSKFPNVDYYGFNGRTPKSAQSEFLVIKYCF